MGFLRQHKFVLGFLALLVFCSVMVIRQMNVNQSRHGEILDAFILLHTKGYTNEAQRLYVRLLGSMPNLPNQRLFEDFRRTLPLVDPTVQQPENLIWKYHWTVSLELEKREDPNLVSALELAREVAREVARED